MTQPELPTDARPPRRRSSRACCARRLRRCARRLLHHARPPAARPTPTTTASAIRSPSPKASARSSCSSAATAAASRRRSAPRCWRFAQAWKREATGGIVIDVPTGTPNETRRRRCAARSALDPRRRRRAAARGRACGPTGRSIRACSRRCKLNYSEHGRRCRTLRTVAGRSRPDRRPQLQREPASTAISAAPRSAISPPWSTTRPTWCSRAAKRRPTPARRTAVLDKYRKGESHGDRSIRMPRRARSATSANDQDRRIATRRPSRRGDAPRATSTSRRCRASRSRPSARPSRSPPPCRPPARTGAWPRRI